MSQNEAALRAHTMKRRAKGAKGPETMENWLIFLEELRAARIHRRLTHKQVAEALGLSLAQFSGWERGVSAPHPHDLVIWCQFLGVALTTKPIE